MHDRPFLLSGYQHVCQRLCFGFLLSSYVVHHISAILDPTPEEKRMMWKYPNCDHLKTEPFRKVDWLWYKNQLHELGYPDSVRDTLSVLQNLTGGSGSSSAECDEEARVCLMGVPAAFFYLTKYSLESTYENLDPDGNIDPAMLRNTIMQYSVFENYISVFHPGLIDNANWTLTDKEIGKLRRDVLRATRQLELQEEKEKKRESSGDHLAGKSTAPSEKPLKVYVYEEDEVPELGPLTQGQIYCSRGQWGMDVTLHDLFLTCPCRTDDPKEADFFFVPGYAICTLEGNMHGNWAIDKVDELYSSLVTALPYFKASGGRDHVFVFGSGMAHSVFQSWRDYIPQSIVLTPETELFNDFAWIIEPPFQTWRDIAIPGALDLTEVISLLHFNKPLEEREYLGAFFGRTDSATRGPHPWVGGVDTRKEIIELMENSTTEGEFAFGGDKTHDVMHGSYGNARFCFIPRGKSGWSLRFFEALFAGCVPVMLSDKWELPFEDFLDVTKFVIKWPSTQIGPQLTAYLRDLPDTIVRAYMEEARKVRCWYFYAPKKIDVRENLRKQSKVCPEENGQDVFQGVLRLLRLKRRQLRTSVKSFYFRDARGGLQRVDGDMHSLA